MALVPVEDALARLLGDVAVLGAENVPLAEAAGRVLARPVDALRTQPPFPASAMDGYAVRADDLAQVPARLAVIGEAPAGRQFVGTVGPGQAVRIFTGAPVPEGADAILIQENARRLDAGTVEATETVTSGRHIRRLGLDFSAGERLLEAGRRLDAAALSLAAAANHAGVEVVKAPLVAIISTGDELRAPGSTDLMPDQIIASNAVGVAAIAREAGARVFDLGIVPDRASAISAAYHQAREASADVIVTLGGASVGDHDLIHDVLTGEGMILDFWRIAMRPGKPLMFGRHGTLRIVGLPGNPVASLVCTHLFLKPLLLKLAGRTFATKLQAAVLAAPMSENDHRQDYVRATVREADGHFVAKPFEVQDSSMLKTLAAADALIVRPPHAPAARAGDACQVLMLR